MRVLRAIRMSVSQAFTLAALRAKKFTDVGEQIRGLSRI
jgi:hypothetical protein